MMTAQLHTEAASSSSNTPLTTGSALTNKVTIERDALGPSMRGLAIYVPRWSCVVLRRRTVRRDRDRGDLVEMLFVRTHQYQTAHRPLRRFQQEEPATGAQSSWRTGTVLQSSKPFRRTGSRPILRGIEQEKARCDPS